MAPSVRACVRALAATAVPWSATGNISCHRERPPPCKTAIAPSAASQPYSPCSLPRLESVESMALEHVLELVLEHVLASRIDGRRRTQLELMNREIYSVCTAPD